MALDGGNPHTSGVDPKGRTPVGTMEIGFLAIKPGSYYLKIPGSTGEGQRAENSIR